MSVLEPPIERVNYFNGERLEARDFRAEQEFQLRVRRLVNRWLYSPGIVRGLEVTKHPSDKHKVIVKPGLAFDFEGREIFILEPEGVQVAGAPSTSPGVVFGNFLVISYTEHRGQPSREACHTTAEPCGCEVAWRGPMRIRSEALLEFVNSWPSEASGRIVLAQIELQQGCEVAAVHSGVRKYAVTAKPPKVRPVSLEGEKDIDSVNPKLLFFHVDGSYPDAVTLHLRASRFSTLHYTEMGRHTHELQLALEEAGAVPEHDHTLETIQMEESGEHSHTVTAHVDDPDDHNAVELDEVEEPDVNLNAKIGLKVTGGKHAHTFSAGAKTGMAPAVPAHTHDFASQSILEFGALPNAKDGPALTYIDDLHVWFDSTDITDKILEQLAGRDPANWPNGTTLGDGTATHVLVTDGTKGINLLPLVSEIGPGEHKLELKVTSGGGQIHYNLYVE